MTQSRATERLASCPDKTAATGMRKFSVNSSDRPTVRKTKPIPKVSEPSTCAVGAGTASASAPVVTTRASRPSVT